MTRGTAPSASPRLFDPLEATDFQHLEHGASLKGLLKPFKGKGELQGWGNECRQIRDGLLLLAHRLLAQASTYPFDRLPVLLALQTTGAGTAFLRWRSADRSAMGVSQWKRLIADPATPVPLLHELHALEVERIALNMQISLTHTLAQQALACAEKMAQAQSHYEHRIHPSDPTGVRP